MSFIDDEKKKREVFFVLRFRDGSKLDFEYEPGESPDFVLTHHGRRVGLEITRIFHPAAEGSIPRQALENYRRRIVAEAERKYVDAKHPALNVSIRFNPAYSIGKDDVPRLVAMIFSIVASNIPGEGQLTDVSYSYPHRDWFPVEVDSIACFRLPDSTASSWYAPDAEFVPYCTSEQLQASIDEKRRKLQTYLSKVDECWLLLVADDCSLSGSFDVPQTTLAHRYSCPFHRAFLLQTSDGRVSELPRLSSNQT